MTLSELRARHGVEGMGPYGDLALAVAIVPDEEFGGCLLYFCQNHLETAVHKDLATPTSDTCDIICDECYLRFRALAKLARQAARAPKPK
jgi:hypothetical protein